MKWALNTKKPLFYMNKVEFTILHVYTFEYTIMLNWGRFVDELGYNKWQNFEVLEIYIKNNLLFDLR